MGMGVGLARFRVWACLWNRIQLEIPIPNPTPDPQPQPHIHHHLQAHPNLILPPRQFQTVVVANPTPHPQPHPHNFTHTFQSQTHPLPPLWPQSHIQINDKPNNLKGGGKSCQKELLGGWEFWKSLEDLGCGWAEAVGRSWGVIGIFDNVRRDRGGGWPRAVGRLLTPPP